MQVTKRSNKIKRNQQLTSCAPVKLAFPEEASVRD